jgi:hypothetical protein
MGRCIWIVILAVACSGGSDDSETEAVASPCEQLRAHLADLQLADVSPATEVDLAAHRSAMISALGEGFLASCARDFSESQVECAIAATDSAAAAACTARR